MSFETLFNSPRPISQDNIAVEYQDSYNRLEVPSLDADAIDATWKSLTARASSQTLFNGLKFRLHDVLVDAKDAIPTPDDLVDGAYYTVPVGKCVFRLGLTDYKTSVGTCKHIDQYRNHAAQQQSAQQQQGKPSDASDSGFNSVSLPHDGAASHASNLSRVERYLANALGCEALVVTSDRYAVMFRRSMLVNEYPGYYCSPGGHPEPARVAQQEKQRQDETTVGECSLDDVHTKLMSSRDCIASELFTSITEEVSEEIGVDVARCQNKGLIGVACDRITRKPDMIFFVLLDVDRAAVQSQFDSRRSVDSFESVEGSLRFLDLNKMKTPSDVREYVAKELDGCITPASYASLLHGVLCLPHVFA